MGVPKFYRWISERYPKINQIVSDTALLPEIDHLYLDLNGIIHGCTHPNDRDNITDQLSERDMMLGIMHYLDRLITQIAKPKVSVFMAIDGVAPRAKLNQQRSRRFRSAKELAEERAAAAKATKARTNEQSTDDDDVFDSNCITPGTEFLEKVSLTIQFFIRNKLAHDALWKGLTVIFSGHDIPGEGEHKIMQHVREMRISPHYQANTRHCIYGQDADLILLGLVTHEPQFVILREVVDFMSWRQRNQGQENTLKQVKKFTKESDFQLLHLSVLREYLALEFCNTGIVKPVKDGETTTAPLVDDRRQYDLERCIDDFVFLTFLVGNDFLPHMPTLDIGDGAFDLLFDTYRKQRAELWNEPPYLTHAGTICDLSRLETFLMAIGAVETDILVQREKDQVEYVKKKRRWDKRDGKAPSGPSNAELAAQETQLDSNYQEMLQQMYASLNIRTDNLHKSMRDWFVDGWKPVPLGEKDFKGRYYYEKLGLKPIDKQQHLNLRQAYLEGLIWCLAYYYQGCISWGWFYPYHYGPMLSDLRNLTQFEIKFELGDPLTPFQQLMGCLPPASCQLVPKLYRWLMMSPESPIIQFYPTNFAVDMNGKKNPWEGVNLLPFIDVVLLKKTIAQHCPASKLSPAERRRNAFGKVYVYKHDITCTEVVPAPLALLKLPDIPQSHSSITILDEPSRAPGRHAFEPRLLPGTQIPYPGFPSLNVLPICQAEHLHLGLNCFGTPSKYPTLVLKLPQMHGTLPALELLADNLLNRSIFCNWPMMHEAKVVAISNEHELIRFVETPNKPKKKLKGKIAAAANIPVPDTTTPSSSSNRKVLFDRNEREKWLTASEQMYQMYHIGNGIPGSGGVDIGKVLVRLKVLPLQGMRTNRNNGSTQKVFGKQEAEIPLQLALMQAPAPDPRFVPRPPMTLVDRFPLQSRVVLTKGKYRACVGTVVGHVEKSVAVQVETLPAELPFGLAIARSVQETYMSSGDAARMCKIHPGLLGKITGRLQFEGKYDLGLNLKSNFDGGTCVVGFTRRKRMDRNRKQQAWSAGDALLVVGSARAGDKDDENEERIQWEYSTKTVQAIQEYMSKFPQLFSQLKKFPNEKKYNAGTIFGPDGDSYWLPTVREWLNQHASASLPRVPVTSECLSGPAVAAVQRAADVRTLALNKRGYPRELLLKIPGNALYRQGSTDATDVLLASDLNFKEGPVLGDRICNLSPDAGIPFGARGTVVAIHDAERTMGSVEVVMDTPFYSGNTLQGACSMYRGKLVVWSHLLKVAPATEHSKELNAMVEKLVPKTQQHNNNRNRNAPASVDKLLSSIEREVNKGAGPLPAGAAAAAATPAPAEAAPVPAVTTPETQQQPASKPRAKSPIRLLSRQERETTPQRAASRGRSASTDRTGSTGRGTRQGTWREAKGPPETPGSAGFPRGVRKGKTGIVRWKQLMKQSKAPPPPAAAAVSPAAQLKSLLGVVPGGAVAAPPVVQAPAPPPVAAGPSTNAELKALLGVSPTPTPMTTETPAVPVVIAPPASMLPVPSMFAEDDEPAPSSNDASAGLKAMLGVGGGGTTSAPPPPPPPPEPKPPTSAADHLLQLLANKQQQHRMPPPPQVPQSAFNFTYVQAGQPPPQHHHHHHPHPQHQFMGYPPPPPHMAGMPPPHMMPPPQFMQGGGPPPPFMVPHQQQPTPFVVGGGGAPPPQVQQQQQQMPAPGQQHGGRGGGGGGGGRSGAGRGGGRGRGGNRRNNSDGRAKSGGRGQQGNVQNRSRQKQQAVAVTSEAEFPPLGAEPPPAPSRPVPPKPGELYTVTPSKKPTPPPPPQEQPQAPAPALENREPPATMTPEPAVVVAPPPPPAPAMLMVPSSVAGRRR